MKGYANKPMLRMRGWMNEWMNEYDELVIAWKDGWSNLW